jgi:hypothetical protein
LAAVLCELRGYKPFLVTVSAFRKQNPLTAKIAKGNAKIAKKGVIHEDFSATS